MSVVKFYTLNRYLMLSLLIPVIILAVNVYYKIFPIKILPEGYEKYNVSPAEYAVILLANNVISELQNKKLSGYAMGVEKVYGEEDKHIDNLKLTFNSALVQYDRWKLLTDKEQFELIKQRRQLDFEQKKALIHAGLIDPKKYLDFLIASDRIQINYDVILKWHYVDTGKTLCMLICDVVNRKTSLVEVTSNIVFTHPCVYKKYMGTIQFITYASYVSYFYIVAVVVTILNLWLYINFKKKKLIQELPSLEEKLNTLVQNGSFVAALNMVEKVLSFLPEDTNFIAVKERLRIITKDNPEKAEEMYVKYVKLREKFRNGLQLEKKDMEELSEIESALVLPEITKFASLAKKYFEIVELNTKLRSCEEKIWICLQAGKLQQAKIELDKLFNDEVYTRYKVLVSSLEPEPQVEMMLPPHIDTSKLAGVIEERIKKSEENMYEVKRLLSSGNFYRAEQLLVETIRINSELQDAENLLKEIQEAKSRKFIYIVSENINDKVVVIKKDVVKFFRKDKEEPDIEVNLPQISRDRHLRISIVGDKVIAEDEGSTNGSYVGGQKITKCELQDGDVVNLAGVYMFTVYFYRGEVMVDIPQELKVTIPAGQQRRNGTGYNEIIALFIHPLQTKDNIKYLIIPPRKDKTEILTLPVRVGLTGIEYSKDKNSDVQFLINNDTVALKIKDVCHILLPNKIFEYSSLRYKVN